MHEEQDIIEQLHKLGYTPQEINNVVHKIILLKIQERKRKPKPLAQRMASNIIMYITSSIKKLCGKALCLLHTQFAKKPKNPV